MTQTGSGREHRGSISGRSRRTRRSDWPGRAWGSTSAWWARLQTTPLERPSVRASLLPLGALAVAAGIAALLGSGILFTGFAYGAAVLITFLPPFPYRNGLRSLPALLFLMAVGPLIFWCGQAI